jgi:hypothetical protein
MASGLPWVSSSVIASGSTWAITFPYVTNHLSVQNAGTSASTLGVGFTLSGSQGSNRFLLSSNATVQAQFSEHLRITTLYITALTNNVTASVFAGLTTIQARQFPVLTGSAPVAFDPTGSVYENYLSYPGLG